MFAKGIKWNWTAAVSFLTLHAHIMKLRKGSSGGRGSLECLSFSPSWLCRLGLFALERVSVSIFHSSWGNLLKELFYEITVCKRALYTGAQGQLPDWLWYFWRVRNRQPRMDGNSMACGTLLLPGPPGTRQVPGWCPSWGTSTGICSGRGMTCCIFVIFILFWKGYMPLSSL